jgi:hypothetical protein
MPLYLASFAVEGWARVTLLLAPLATGPAPKGAEGGFFMDRQEALERFWWTLWPTKTVPQL